MREPRTKTPTYFFVKEKTGAPDKVRTRDPLITNQVLYQLSYKGNPVRVELADSFLV